MSKGDLDLDAEWKKQWDLVCEKFVKVTGGKQLKAAHFKRGPAEMQSVLLENGRKDRKLKKWQGFAQSTGKLALKLSQAAASIGAMFFGPTELCMNAVNFLVDAAKAYHKIFKDLQVLFDKLANALERFEQYRQAQDVLAFHIRKRANEILLKLVSVCGLAYGILCGSWVDKASVAFKAAFLGDDSGVSDEIKALEELADRELQMNVVETVIQSTTTTVLAKEIQVTLANDKQIPWLTEQLTSDNQQEIWRRNMDTVSYIASSGTWIRDVTEFQAWADPTAVDNRVLWINGSEGSGKTILVTKVVEILSNMFPKTMDTSTTVIPVFYYFMTEQQTIEAALRTLAMQLARTDELYAKNLCTTLKNHLRTDGIPTLAQSLFDLLFVSTLASGTIYLLFDDIHLLEDASPLLNLVNLVATTQSTFDRIKLLLSGRLASMTFWKAAKDDLKKIEIDSQNKDMLSFLEYEVQNLPLLQGTGTVQTELKKEIFETLSNSVSFRAARLVLSEIRVSSTPTKIREQLAAVRTGSTTDTGIQWLLERSNQLSADDVKDLNTLLEWVLSFKVRPLKVSELAIALRCRGSEQSLKPLDERLQVEFRGFFNVSKTSEVTLAIPALQEHFEELTKEQQEIDHREEQSNLLAEVKVLQRMLKNMCDDEMYNRFGFESFFQSKITATPKVFVNVDQMDANVVLDIANLCSSPLDYNALEVQEINMEAPVTWCPSLTTLDLSLLDAAQKSRLAKSFVPMLYNEADILRWQFASSTPYILFYDSGITDGLLRWLQDSIVQRNVTSDQKDWIVDVLASPLDSKEKLWLPIFKRKVNQWLYQENLACDPAACSNFQSFYNVRGFVSLFDHFRDPNVKLLTAQEVQTIAISKEDIENVIDKTKKILKIESFTGEALCRIAKTFDNFRWPRAAIEQYRAAELADPELLAATVSRTRMLWKIGDKQEAINSMIVFIQRLIDQNIKNKHIIYRYREILADWYQSLGQSDKAMELLDLNLAAQPCNSYSIAAKLEILSLQGKYEECKSMVKTMIPMDFSEFYDASETNGTEDLEDDDDIVKAMNYIPEEKQLDVNNLDGETTIGSDEKSHNDHSSDKDNDSENKPADNADNDSREGTTRDPIFDAYSDFESEPDGFDSFLTFLQSNEIKSLLGTSRGGRFHKVIDAIRQADVLDDLDERLLVNSKILRMGRVAVADDLEGNTIYTVVDLSVSLYIAAWVCRYSKDGNVREKAINLCERTVKQADKQMGASASLVSWGLLIQFRQITCQWLSSIYLDEARKLPSGSKEEQDCIEKVEAFFGPGQLIPEKELMIGSFDLKDVTLSAYHAGRGNTEAARNLLRQHMKTALDLLSDDDPDNDWLGYLRIGSITRLAGSTEDCLAAFSLIGPSSDQRVSDGSATHESASTPNQNLKGPVEWPCTGNCGHVWTFASDLYLCKTCLWPRLEKSCWTALREGRFVPYTCDPSHEFLYIPPWDFAKAERIGKGMVEVDGTVISIEDWKARLRATWKVPEI